ncbi:MAG TPA: hypothetical protein VH643_21210 [Gemmataceae bacterium]|jgi:hypothetical protein
MADELDFDPNVFRIDGPVWVIVDQNVLKPDESTGGFHGRGLDGLLTIKTDKGYSILPVFTDEDSVREFLLQMGDTKLVACGIDPAAGLGAMLEGAEGRGCLAVTFDPRHGRQAVKAISLDKIREAIKRRQGNHE